MSPAAPRQALPLHAQLRQAILRALGDAFLGVPAKLALMYFDRTQATAGNRRQDD